MFWSGQGNDLENTMTHSVTGGERSPPRCATRSRTDYDYAYLEATSDGTTWTPCTTNLSSTTNPNGAQPRARHHGHHDRRVGRPHGHRAGRDDRDPVPLLDRPVRERAGLPGRQHHPGRPGHRDRRAAGRGLDLQRLPARRADRAGDREALQRLHRREPSVRRVRRVAEDGVQLRLPGHGEGQLGGDPSLHAGPAHHLLGRPSTRTTTSGSTPGTARSCPWTPTRSSRTGPTAR